MIGAPFSAAQDGAELSLACASPYHTDVGEREVDAIAEIRRHAERTFYVGSAYWLGAQIFVRLINFAAGIALARWLQPEDFGLMSLGLTVTTLIALFGNVGISHYAIYLPREDREALSSGFWLGVFLGAGLFLIQVVTAPLVARFYGHPEVTSVLIALSLTLLITPWGAVHAALLRRRLEIAKLVLPQVTTTVIGTGIALAMAFHGAGVWSLVAPMVLAAPITAILNWRFCRWRPLRRWPREHARAILRYGRHVLGNDLVSYAMQNADYILIGKRLGTAPLGLYTFAYNQSLMLPVLWMGIFSHVAFPLFARLREDSAALRAAYLKFIRASAGATIPLLILLLVAADEYVRVLYGEKWMPAVLPLRLLLLHAIARCLSLGAGEMFNAIGRPDLTFACSLGAAPVFIAAVALSVRWGIEGVATATALVFWGMAAALIGVLLRTLRWAIGDLLKALRPVALSALLIGAIAHLAHQLGERAGLIPSAVLFLTLAGGGAAHLLMIRTLFRTELRELLQAFRIPKTPPR